MTAKNVIVSFIVSFLVCCCVTGRSSSAGKFTPADFEAVRDFILKNGDRQTYCNMFNDNPHYRFGELDVFLNPAPAGPFNHPQYNINCEPGASDFEWMVIRTPESIYYDIEYDKDKRDMRISSRGRNVAGLRGEVEGYLREILGRASRGR